MHANRWNILLAMLFLVPFMGFAEETSPTSAPPSDDGTLKLSVQECVIMALENNLDLSINRIDPQLSLTLIQQARGAFDPIFTLSPGYSESLQRLTAQNSLATGGLLETQSRDPTINTSLQGKIPTGTIYNFGLQTFETEGTVNNFKSEFNSTWGATLSQPLLKGFGIDNQLYAIRNARKQKEISDEVFAFSVIDVITNTKIAYYELIYAIEYRKIQLEALDLASKTLEENKVRVSAGVLIPLDITEAEFGVAQSEQAVVLADQDLHTKMNTLRSFISQNIIELRKKFLLPIDPLTDAPSLVYSFEDALSIAIENRPDYHQAKLIIDQQQLTLKYNENQSYPQLDLQGSYQFNGVGNNFSDSITTDNHKWTVGVTFSMPLPDQSGQALRENSALQKQRALLQLKKSEQIIALDIDNSLDSLNSSHERILTARKQIVLAQKKLNAETEKLNAGTTTSSEVLRFQKDLTNAKSEEIRALLDYNTALARFEQKKGTTLLENNINLINK
jgi:outer membrane protein